MQNERIEPTVAGICMTVLRFAKFTEPPQRSTRLQTQPGLPTEDFPTEGKFQARHEAQHQQRAVQRTTVPRKTTQFREGRSTLRIAWTCWVAVWVAGVANLVLPANTWSADFSAVRATFFRGEYDECIALSRAEVEKGVWNDYWSRLLIETLLTTGKYREARDVYEQVATKFGNSISLRLLAADAYRYSGDVEKGNQLLNEIPQLLDAAPWRYSDRDNLLAIGNYFASQGEDARIVLDIFFDRSLKVDPKYVEAHIAVAQLALDKADYQEAVKSLKVAMELRPDDPHIRYLLARAWAPSDSKQAAANLQAALDLNPRHAESLLLAARKLIDAEAYTTAADTLDDVFAVNPNEPRGLALKAAIAHLTGDYKVEGEYRTRALSSWNMNPRVDYLIGETLSHHYRFAEGVKYQRRALKLDPNYLPAQFQLAQDLLRVGADDEGWTIVDRVAEADKYNVVAFNLKTLQQRLEKFTTLEAPGLIVRMDARESLLYGPRVIELLTEAKQVLCAKYDVELTQPVTVEIFPQQSDFAIRTFGLPGGAGFLGVCFGNLVTANSPASQGATPSNWESVLWHEFCHVITLNKTKNRMPRWMSEGISVYEELERDASWGQRMTPTYKSMLLGEDMVPLSQLSRAFLQPKSPLHLQFAYFESSLAVRYLIEVHGLPLLLKLLDDLGMGVPLEEAFERRYGDAEILDNDFAAYINRIANEFYPETTFARGDLGERPSLIDVERTLKENPKHYIAQRAVMERLVTAKRWPEALAAAQGLLELYPEDTTPGGALDSLIGIALKMEDTAAERKALLRMVELTSDNVRALLRLIELTRADEQWRELASFSSQLLAVQPLITTGHEGLVLAARKLGEPQRAIDSLRALTALEPVDPARIQFELADALVATADAESARIEVLKALEMSPRYREAQKLLVSIHRSLHPLPLDSLQLQVELPDDAPPPRPR